MAGERLERPTVLLGRRRLLLLIGRRPLQVWALLALVAVVVLACQAAGGTLRFNWCESCSFRFVSFRLLCLHRRVGWGGWNIREALVLMSDGWASRWSPSEESKCGGGAADVELAQANWTPASSAGGAANCVADG